VSANVSQTGNDVEFVKDNQFWQWAEKHGPLFGERFDVRLPELPSKRLI
jgi:hypothetical protein